ncbi:MAG: hypothetical protein JO112_16905 [Planctomycetes bacterium]|nr:hypothetical protein [Planctomycetota bacterium]
MKVKNAIYRGKLRTVEDAVEAWKAEHHEAMGVRMFEEVVRECLAAHTFFQDIQKERWGQLWAGQIREIQTTGENFLRVLETSLIVYSLVEECLLRVKRAGYSVNGEEEFEKAFQELRSAAADFKSRWPFVDHQQIEESRAAFAQGESQSVEEILGELQGSDTGQH